MVWDIHHHWVNENEYIDRLLRKMDDSEIERLGLIAMGPIAKSLFVTHEPSGEAVGNEELAPVIKEHKDRLWGYGYVQPGHSKPEDIDRLVEMGMSALKFHLPVKPYSHPEYLKLYAKAAEYNLPCLFHTGIFYLPNPILGEGISSENCRPIHLEIIANEFPDLPLIAAHLGVCWNDEAATLCRIYPNIYTDISGRIDGWRSSRPTEWFQQIFYWPQAHKKILFGSDAHADDLQDSLEHQQGIFKKMGWGQRQIEDVFCNNAKDIFGN